MSSVIVVEGYHDEARLKSIYPDVNIVVTNGSEVSIDTIRLIKALSKTNTIIIFTDPDAPGERIRSQITLAVPNAYHAFIRKKNAISKNGKKVGIEHASVECIKESLSQVYSYLQQHNTIELADMYAFGLMGMPHSAQLREDISEALNIGKPNAKTFLKRLNMLQIKKEELKKYVENWKYKLR